MGVGVGAGVVGAGVGAGVVGAGVGAQPPATCLTPHDVDAHGVLGFGEHPAHVPDVGNVPAANVLVKG